MIVREECCEVSTIHPRHRDALLLARLLSGGSRLKGPGRHASLSSSSSYGVHTESLSITNLLGTVQAVALVIENFTRLKLNFLIPGFEFLIEQRI